MIDLGGFSKFMLEGPGAAPMLDRLLCSRLPKPGRIGLCYALDRQGRHRQRVHRHPPRRGSLLSASPPAPPNGTTRICCGPPCRPTASARLEPVSGPARHSRRRRAAARDVLAQVTAADLSNAAFPWLAAREIELGFGRALALRVNYVGELGWELHLPMEQLLPAYEAIMAAGATRGIRDVGIYAVDSMRLDKCYRSWKQDLETGFSGLRGRPRPVRRPDQAGLRRQGGTAGRTCSVACASAWCR